MKIMHVNQSLMGGGVEQYLSQVLKEIRKRNHDNIILYGAGEEHPSIQLNAKSFFVKGISQSRCHDLKRKLEEVERVLKHENPDIVMLHQVYNSPLINLITRQKPSIRFVHDFKLICPDGKKLLQTQKECPFPFGLRCQVHAYLYRCMPRNFFSGLPLILECQKIAHMHKTRSHMLVASEFMKSVLLYNKYKEKKIEVIPYFTPLAGVSRSRSGRHEPTVLYVGRIAHSKGVQRLLESFSKLDHNARLVIVGDGPALTEMKELLKNRGMSSKVVFMGWISHDEIDKYYEQCSLVVVPSIWPEPFGIVGIEAMAHEKPVVAFDVGGISEWLKDGINGFLVRPGNETELAEKIQTLLHNPDQAKKMGKKGKEMVRKRFTPEPHLEALTNLFQKVLRDSNKGI